METLELTVEWPLVGIVFEADAGQLMAKPVQKVRACRSGPMNVVFDALVRVTLCVDGDIEISYHQFGDGSGQKSSKTVSKSACEARPAESGLKAHEAISYDFLNPAAGFITSARCQRKS